MTLAMIWDVRRLHLPRMKVHEIRPEHLRALADMLEETLANGWTPSRPEPYDYHAHERDVKPHVDADLELWFIKAYVDKGEGVKREVQDGPDDQPF